MAQTCAAFENLDEGNVNGTISVLQIFGKINTRDATV